MSARKRTREREAFILALEICPALVSESEDARLDRILKTMHTSLMTSQLASLYERSFIAVGPRMYRVSPIGKALSIAFFEIIDAIRAQADLLWEGLPVKGCLTLGPVVTESYRAVTESRWGGAGVNQAQRALDRMDDPPRIIIDPRVLLAVETDPRMRAPHHSVPQELGYLKRLLRRDADGRWLIDYLIAFESELNDPPTMYPKYLERHRNMVSKVLRSSHDPAGRVGAWLRTYHNDVVEARYGRDSEEASALRVGDEAGRFYDFPSTIEPA